MRPLFRGEVTPVAMHPSLTGVAATGDVCPTVLWQRCDGYDDCGLYDTLMIGTKLYNLSVVSVCMVAADSPEYPELDVDIDEYGSYHLLDGLVK